jgi:hypothetical protein
MDLKKLKKIELEELCLQLQKELKESRSFVANIKKQKDSDEKDFLAVSVVKVNGIYSMVKVKFDINDIYEIDGYKQGVHMADFKAREFLVKDIIHKNFQYEGKL